MSISCSYPTLPPIINTTHIIPIDIEKITKLRNNITEILELDNVNIPDDIKISTMTLEAKFNTIFYPWNIYRYIKKSKDGICDVVKGPKQKKCDNVKNKIDNKNEVCTIENDLEQKIIINKLSESDTDLKTINKYNSVLNTTRITSKSTSTFAPRITSQTKYNKYNNYNNNIKTITKNENEKKTNPKDTQSKISSTSKITSNLTNSTNIQSNSTVKSTSNTTSNSTVKSTSNSTSNTTSNTASNTTSNSRSKTKSKVSNRQSDVFLNQVTVSIVVKNKDKPVSVKIFNNGTVHFTGCVTIDNLLEATYKLCSECCRDIGILDKNGKIKDIKFVENKEMLRVENLCDNKVDMINCIFVVPFKIDRPKLQVLMKADGYNASYDSNGHAGVKIKYSNNEKKITIFVFESGSIIIILGKQGFNRIIEIFNFIYTYLLENYESIVKDDDITTSVILECLTKEKEENKKLQAIRDAEKLMEDTLINYNDDMNNIDDINDINDIDNIDSININDIINNNADIVNKFDTINKINKINKTNKSYHTHNVNKTNKSYHTNNINNINKPKRGRPRTRIIDIDEIENALNNKHTMARS